MDLRKVRPPRPAACAVPPGPRPETNPARSPFHRRLTPVSCPPARGVCPGDLPVKPAHRAIGRAVCNRSGMPVGSRYGVRGGDTGRWASRFGARSRRYGVRPGGADGWGRAGSTQASAVPTVGDTTAAGRDHASLWRPGTARRTRSFRRRLHADWLVVGRLPRCTASVVTLGSSRTERRQWTRPMPMPWSGPGAWRPDSGRVEGGGPARLTKVGPNVPAPPGIGLNRPEAGGW